jgi:Holliday junction resolvase
MDNPFLRRTSKSNNSHGRKSEERLAKSMAAKLTPGSGAMDHAKGDMVREGENITLRIEAKCTNKASISIKHEWLEKITREALETNCQPALTISFVSDNGAAKKGGDWVMIPKTVFDLLEELK